MIPSKMFCSKIFMMKDVYKNCRKKPILNDLHWIILTPDSLEIKFPKYFILIVEKLMDLKLSCLKSSKTIGLARFSFRRGVWPLKWWSGQIWRLRNMQFCAICRDDLEFFSEKWIFRKVSLIIKFIRFSKKKYS